jgi:hypothetical protein
MRMAGLVEISRQIRRWALANKMFGDAPVAPAYDKEIVNKMFVGSGVPATTSIFQRRGISYIGINEEDNAVVIFTQRRMTIKERNIVAAAGGLNTNIIVHQGGYVQAGKLPAAPVGKPPFEEYNGRYTCGSSIYLSTEKGAGTLGCLVQDKDGVLCGAAYPAVPANLSYS